MVVMMATVSSHSRIRSPVAAPFMSFPPESAQILSRIAVHVNAKRRSVVQASQMPARGHFRVNLSASGATRAKG
jgi:hypothetical protein